MQDLVKFLLEKGASPYEMCLINIKFNTDIDEKLRLARKQYASRTSKMLF